jgi:hypothetical protein
MTTTMSQAEDDCDADAAATIKISALSDQQLAALDIPPEPDPHAAGALTSEIRTALRRLTPPAPRAEVQAQWLAMPAPLAAAHLAAAHRAASLPTWPSTGRESPSSFLLAAAPLARVRAILEDLVARGRPHVLSLFRTISRLAAECFSKTRRERVIALCRVQRQRWDAFQARLSASSSWSPLLSLRPRLSRIARVGPADRT